jgi:hypothetical protein
MDRMKYLIYLVCAADVVWGFWLSARTPETLTGLMFITVGSIIALWVYLTDHDRTR